MTNEQINVAIIEACGWEPRKDAEGNIIAWQSPGAYRAFSPDDLPDYCNDLNAMHEEEKSLTSAEQCRKYADILDDENGGHFATASQKAEAFLKTIGKWEE